jgi:hypothetical protein
MLCCGYVCLAGLVVMAGGFFVAVHIPKQGDARRGCHYRRALGLEAAGVQQAFGPGIEARPHIDEDAGRHGLGHHRGLGFKDVGAGSRGDDHGHHHLLAPDATAKLSQGDDAGGHGDLGDGG